MKACMNRLASLCRSEDGPTTTEYAVLLALIIVGVIGAMSSFGLRVESIYTTLTGTIPTGA